MKLKNFLMMPETRIAMFLRDKGFTYDVGKNYNYGWANIISICGKYVCDAIIFCDLNNCKLNIGLAYVDSVNDRDYIEIDIPKELIEKDDPFEFIDWLDETCEPYFD